jgi:hypothetical protein
MEKRRSWKFFIEKNVKKISSGKFMLKNAKKFNNEKFSCKISSTVDSPLYAIEGTGKISHKCESFIWLA